MQSTDNVNSFTLNILGDTTFDVPYMIICMIV